MRGLFPANVRDRQGLGPTTRFLGIQSKQAPHTDPADGAIACPRSRSRIPRGESTLPDLTGRRITMDERLCRSVRWLGPNDWCGTVAGRRRHVQC
jgi:hypothetical protein